MVGYDDTYNRALTARSNALQRRKGQMIDRLNGSGRGDEEDDDDYLSDGMEGGGAYEDEYEDEMVGGSFEEASREVGGMRTGGRSTGGIAPLLLAAAPALAAAAAPIIGGLFSKVMGLFGRGYSGGKRQVKAQMLADLKASMKGMRGSARLLPKMRDIAYDTAQEMMKDRRYRPQREAMGRGMSQGGRATGGFLPMLALAAAPMLGAKLASMLGLGRNSPIMRGAGFFDWVKKAASDVGNFLAPVGRVLAPVAEALAPLAKDAAVGFVKGKIGAMGKGKCCKACGGQKQSPYDLMYGGAMLARTANAATHRRNEDRDFQDAVGESIHGADRLDREVRYAKGAGGKRLYMKGGVGGQLAPMGQESMFGYDNDEQPYGLTPPRNVASRGYIQGGQRYLTPVDQMRPTVGGKRGGASAWINHVKSYASKHGVSYKDALSQASASYRK